MSRSDRVIRVTKGGNPQDLHRVSNEHAANTKQPQVFVDMQRNMEDELEKRRHDWEKEVEQMQHDFFQLKSKDSSKSLSSGEYSSSPGRDRDVAVSSHMSVNPLKPVGPAGNDIFDISNRKNLYTDMPDGSKMFKMRFDVRGFDPEEISVRADGSKMTVTAKKEEEYGGKNKNTRQYNRQADIPEDVDPDSITSALSPDGILTVEAPVMEGVIPRGSAGTIDYDEPLPLTGIPSQMIDFDKPHQFLDSPHEYHRVLESFGGGGGGGSGAPKGSSHHHHQSRHHQSRHSPVHREVEEVQDGCKIITPSKYRQRNNNNESSFRNSDPNVVNTKYGPMLKIEVNIGDYQPEDVKIALSEHKVSVKAKREETIRGRTSRREFSREFDIPEPIQRRYFKAKLTKDGRLVFGGSFMSNSDHDMVLQTLYNTMPIYGTNVQLE